MVIRNLPAYTYPVVSANRNFSDGQWPPLHDRPLRRPIAYDRFFGPHRPENFADTKSGMMQATGLRADVGNPLSPPGTTPSLLRIATPTEGKGNGYIVGDAAHSVPQTRGLQNSPGPMWASAPTRKNETLRIAKFLRADVVIVPYDWIDYPSVSTLCGGGGTNRNRGGQERSKGGF